jgi:hypothetical protein
MTNNFELPIVITVRPSKWLNLWLYITHIFAIPVVFMADLVVPVQVLLIVTICLSLFFSIGKYIYFREANSIVRIILNGADEWWLTTVRGDTISATLLPAALVHPLLVILPFQTRDGTYTVILTPDVTDPDMLRRLRVRLRFPLSGEW